MSDYGQTFGIEPGEDVVDSVVAHVTGRDVSGIARSTRIRLFNSVVDGRRQAPGRRQINIKGLHERQRLIAVGISEGRSNKDIAAELNVTPQTVSNSRNSPVIQAEVDRMMEERVAIRREVQQKLAEHSKAAIDVLHKVMVGPTRPETRVRAAIAILDRSGHGPVQEHKHQGVIAHLTGEDIDELKKMKDRGLDVLRERGKLAAEPTDVECEVSEEAG